MNNGPCDIICQRQCWVGMSIYPTTHRVEFLSLSVQREARRTRNPKPGAAVLAPAKSWAEGGKGAGSSLYLLAPVHPPVQAVLSHGHTVKAIIQI